MRQFWTSGPSTWHHTNSGRGYVQQHMAGDGTVLTCQAMKGYHIETSRTPLTPLNCGCFLCKIFFSICKFFFYFTPFTHTHPALYFYPILPKTLPHNHMNLEDGLHLTMKQTVTATEKILTNTHPALYFYPILPKTLPHNHMNLEDSLQLTMKQSQPPKKC